MPWNPIYSVAIYQMSSPGFVKQFRRRATGRKADGRRTRRLRAIRQRRSGRPHPSRDAGRARAGSLDLIPPLGYLNAPKWSGKSLAPDPDRAPLVTKLSTISRPVDLRVLRKLLTSPLRFQPVDGTWEFSGQAALGKILQGFVVPHRANSVASPAGFEPAFWS